MSNSKLAFCFNELYLSFAIRFPKLKFDLAMLGHWWFSWLCNNLTAIVVYFDQPLGAGHSGFWLKSTFLDFCTFLQDFDEKIMQNKHKLAFLNVSPNAGCHKNAGLAP